ncbi:MAG TPA: undecaprenyl-diphosphatase UppP [Longilinea sp.]|nr:undecaprenyl-diphosphatase UppP [Longilinea sp.]
MTLLQAILLGIVQGLTEFLPISSSGHLVLIPYLAGWSFPADQIMPFDVLVQLGTLVAVIIFFWKDLWDIVHDWVLALIHRKPFETPAARMGWYLILATIPAGLVGLLLKDVVESVFQSAAWTAGFLCVTAALLFLAEWIGKRSRNFEHFTWKDALWMGVFQIISIFPGVSRSGSTISGGMVNNLDRPTAARFSFLMSIPIMLAAGVLGIKDLAAVNNLSAFLPVLLVGFVTAGIVGYLSIRWLLHFLTRQSLVVFSIYCIVAAVLSLGFIFLFGEEQPVTAEADSSAVVTEYRVSVTPELEWMDDTFNVCAENTGVDVLVTVQPVDSLDVANATVLRWSTPATMDGVAFTLGQESVAFIVNPQQETHSAALSDLVQLLGGTTGTWANGSAVVIWTYPDGDEILTMVETELLDGGLIANTAHIAPDPEAVLQAVAADPNAIGFIPLGLLNERVRALALTDAPTDFLTQDVLAISPTTPQEPLTSWLACLQSVLTP